MRHFIFPLFVALSFTACSAEKVAIPVDGQELIFYQAAPLSEPVGGEDFKGSNFIHPLKTPSGFTVTDSEPKDHPHHFGLWWPWKYIESGDRKVLCWELQKGEGIVQATGNKKIKNGLLTESVYIDRKAEDGPRTLLNESTRITASNIIDQPARGYFLDLTITHTVNGTGPVTVSKYRYSGLGFRGTDAWHKDTSTILTSEGNDRADANFQRARWIRIEGTNGNNGTAGILLMGHPDNYNHPEKLRTWNEQHKGHIFVNFNPVMDEPWVLEPGNAYTRRYRAFIYDGTITPQESESLWKNYANP